MCFVKKIKSLKNIKILTGLLFFIVFFILAVSSIQEIIARNYNDNANQVISRNINITEDIVISAVPLISSIPSESSKPVVSAQSAVLINAGGNIIYELNPHKRLPMASTTKIMTAIVAIESGVPLDKTVKITKEMTGAEGSSIYLYENERFTLLDLIYALMLNSANDSAEAIAVSVAGSIEEFADMMNEKARELELKDTNFTNPHGLDSELHYTTAYELAKISAYALQNETFRKITQEKNRLIYPKNQDGSDNKEGARYLRNHNKMLRTYKDAIGVKTGFTKRSGRCLVSAAERDGTMLVAVTLNASNDWNDHAEMLNFGFDNYHSVELCGESEYIFDVNVVNGYRINTEDKTDKTDKTNKKEKKETVAKIKCANLSSESASLPNNINVENISQKIELPRFIYAPVKKGDVIGRMIFMYENQIIGCSVIISCEDVEVDPSKNSNKSNSIISRILEFFKKSEKSE